MADPLNFANVFPDTVVLERPMIVSFLNRSIELTAEIPTYADKVERTFAEVNLNIFAEEDFNVPKSSSLLWMA